MQLCTTDIIYISKGHNPKNLACIIHKFFRKPLKRLFYNELLFLAHDLSHGLLKYKHLIYNHFNGFVNNPG